MLLVLLVLHVSRLKRDDRIGVSLLLLDKMMRLSICANEAMILASCSARLDIDEGALLGYYVNLSISELFCGYISLNYWSSESNEVSHARCSRDRDHIGWNFQGQMISEKKHVSSQSAPFSVVWFELTGGLNP